MYRIKPISFSVQIVMVLLLGFLSYSNYSLHSDLEWYQEAEELHRGERDILMALLPETSIDISKEKLAELLMQRYKNEQVNVLEHHIQWRRFRFFFDEGGRLEAVVTGS